MVIIGVNSMNLDVLHVGTVESFGLKFMGQANNDDRR